VSPSDNILRNVYSTTRCEFVRQLWQEDGNLVRESIDALFEDANKPVNHAYLPSLLSNMTCPDLDNVVNGLAVPQDNQILILSPERQLAAEVLFRMFRIDHLKDPRRKNLEFVTGLFVSQLNKTKKASSGFYSKLVLAARLFALLDLISVPMTRVLIHLPTYYRR
jgi:hypothetical protein